jgi:subtilisin family serine protease
MRLLTRLAPVTAAAVALSALLAPVAVAAPSVAAPSVTGEYVVHARSTAEARAAASALGVEPTVLFERAFAGFAAPLTPAQVAGLRERPGVVGVEEDRPTAPLDPRATPNALGEGVRRAPANWGLDRIDQAALPLSGTFTTRATGAGVTIFVLDTGVDLTHPEFGGRAVASANTVDDVEGDCDGHGTVVAGIAAGRDSGVAPDARVRSVKVLDCAGAGTLSSLLAGVDHVAREATGPSVAVMSWSYGPSDVLLAAVGELVGRGVLVAASAGNTGGDDCRVAPRAAPGVLVVANSTIDDRRHPSSSTGPCVDLYAPGTSIVSSAPGGGTASYTGTSMAAPHAAGVAALYEQTYGDAPGSTVERWIVEHAVPGAITDAGGVPDRLLSTGGL